MLNYCFALLQAETRLAVSVLGLDAGLGVGLHTDTANRDSLALDVLEPIRPQIEAWLLNWIGSEPFRRSDFFETGTGNCRLMSRLCMNLSRTSPVWRKLVEPWAEYVAQALWRAARCCTNWSPDRERTRSAKEEGNQGKFECARPAFVEGVGPTRLADGEVQLSQRRKLAV